MTLDGFVLSELLTTIQAGDGADLVGAGCWERSASRVNERNGRRPKVVSTATGDLEVGIPKLRRGSFFPSILEPAGGRLPPGLVAVDAHDDGLLGGQARPVVTAAARIAHPLEPTSRIRTLRALLAAVVAQLAPVEPASGEVDTDPTSVAAAPPTPPRDASEGAADVATGSAPTPGRLTERDVASGQMIRRQGRHELAVARQIQEGRRPFPFARSSAGEEDLSHDSLDVVLPDAVAHGSAPLRVVGAMAGGWRPRVVAQLVGRWGTTRRSSRQACETRRGVVGAPYRVAPDDGAAPSGGGREVRAVTFDRFGGPEVLQIEDLPAPHAGAGQIRISVGAAGINASDWKQRRGEMDQHLPQTLGYEASGTVDELGEGVEDVDIGDPVFGFCPDGAAQAESAVLAAYAPVPEGLDLLGAAALPSIAETAARALDQLRVAEGCTVLINGASGSVGLAAVQLATARGASVVGVGSPATHEHLRSLGAHPVAYGDGMVERAERAAPGGIDVALDVAGNGILPQLVGMVGGPERVITIADPAGARDTGVRFSRGDTGRATYVLGELGRLVPAGRFSIPVARAFALSDVAEAHRVGEGGHVRGKLVLRVGE